MAQYDVETIMQRIEAFLKAGLNTQIAALNAEKLAAGKEKPILAEVKSQAYFVMTLNDTVVNYNPHIFIRLADVGTLDGIGPGSVKQPRVEILVICEDRGADKLIHYRMLRYLRVLEDLFNASFDTLFPHATFKLNSLAPIALTRLDTNDPYRAVGVAITTTLG